MHPVASGQVHGGVLWNTLLRRRLTRSIVLMKWMKGRCGEREYDHATLSAEKPVKSNCKSLHVHKTANRDLFIFSECVCGGGIQPHKFSNHTLQSNLHNVTTTQGRAENIKNLFFCPLFHLLVNPVINSSRKLQLAPGHMATAELQ